MTSDAYIRTVLVLWSVLSVVMTVGVFIYATRTDQIDYGTILSAWFCSIWMCLAVALAWPVVLGLSAVVGPMYGLLKLARHIHDKHEVSV